MKQTYMHRPNLNIEADFSDEDPPLFRYRLSATLESANTSPKTVCAIMQNPSYAGVDFADKSVQVLERVVFEKGLDEFSCVERLLIVNQFAFIQTTNFEGADSQVGIRNELAISRAISESDIILVAWGHANRYETRKRDIMEIIGSHKNKLLLQTSRHPSRVIYDGFIQPLVNP